MVFAFILSCLLTGMLPEIFGVSINAVLRHRPARPGPRAPAEQGAPLRKKIFFNLVKNG